MEHVGIRDLRNHTTSAVRRAGAGERIVITVDGRPVAQLGPLEALDDRPTLADLAARGWLVLPRRPDRPAPGLVVDAWQGARLDRIVDEVRGRMSGHGTARGASAANRRRFGAMTLALDTTALLARYLRGPERQVVVDAMAADHDWCASALALAEALMLVERLSPLPDDHDDLRRALRDDWERVAVVPVDQRCLDRAAELGRTHPLRTVDALHLAAADRLPRPTAFATFDARQIPVALSLGFEVVSL